MDRQAGRARRYSPRFPWGQPVRLTGPVRRTQSHAMRQRSTYLIFNVSFIPLTKSQTKINADGASPCPGRRRDGILMATTGSDGLIPHGGAWNAFAGAIWLTLLPLGAVPERPAGSSGILSERGRHHPPRRHDLRQRRAGRSGAPLRPSAEGWPDRPARARACPQHPKSRRQPPGRSERRAGSGQARWFGGHEAFGGGRVDRDGAVEIPLGRPLPIATAASCIISPAPWPTIWRPTTRRLPSSYELHQRLLGAAGGMFSIGRKLVGRSRRPRARTLRLGR